jgi:MFS-type transporter involved in bile tolerance (Atg22 family)
LLSTGFVQVRNTAKKIWKDYRALKWFMISLLFSPEAGAGVVLSIAVTYFTVIMEFTVQDVAKATLILMACTVPGSFFAKTANRILNPLNSYRFAMSMLGLSIGMGAFIFTGPERRASVYGLSATWGVFFGWAYPSQRVLVCTLIPKGQETEMMGLFTFTGQILGWLPPLVVTLMNESDVDLKYSLLVVLFFCCFAIVLTLPMGDYKAACEVVERDSAEKLEAVVESAATKHEEPDVEKPVTMDTEVTNESKLPEDASSDISS